MTIRRFSGTWKTRDDVMDNITPNNVVQPNVSVPAGEWKPAAWLPIVWTGEASKDSFVISSGKVVAFDGQGRIVPAGWAKKWDALAAVGDAAITYTSADASAGVIDLSTGEACSAGAVSLADLAEGLLARGLVEEADVGADFFVPNTFNATLAQDCKAVVANFIGAPIGICAYDVYVWAGDSADQLNYLNYQKQHLIQFFTDMQMQVPHAALQVTTTGSLEEGTVSDWTAAAGTDGAEFPSAEQAGAELLVSAPQLAGLARYAATVAATDLVCAFALEDLPATNTERTPIESSSTLLTRERSSVGKISQAGDWYLDADARLLFVYSADSGATSPAGAGETVDYYHYDNVESSADRQVCAVGSLRAGDYVTFDQYSNFVKLDVAASTLPSEICGRVLAVIAQPKGLLDRVRTAWDGSSFSAADKMPGTATAGYTDLITLSPENVAGTSGVADQVVYINVKMS
jgi:hypothetical protein